MTLAPLLFVTLSALAPAQATERLTICLATDANFDPIQPGERLPDWTSEFCAAFVLDEGSSVKRLEAELIALDVGQAAPPRTSVVSVDQDTSKMKRGRFRFSLPRAFPAGKYELDVAADAKPWKKVAFEIAHTDVADALSKPEGLITLEPGALWRYAFAQEVGQGVSLEGQGLTLGDDGKYHAEASIRVAALDAGMAHVEVRRGDTVVTEEWWKLGSSGLLSLRRKLGETTIELDPPQPMFALPCPGFTSWDYAPKDGSFQLQCKQWGPLDLDGPRGKERGYLVLFEQEAPLARLSALRTFVPGVGMTSEVIEQTFNGKVASRQEMLLQRDSAAEAKK